MGYRKRKFPWCAPKTAWAICFGAGIFLVALGLIFAFVAFPAIIDSQVAKELNIWESGTEGQKNFDTPPVAPFIRFWMWEVTNADEVEAAGRTPGAQPVKPRLVERGPYHYVEDRVKVNVSDESESENHVRFGQQKTYYFKPEDSCDGCSESDIITTINPPFIGTVRIVQDLQLPRPLQFLNSVLLRVVNLLFEGEACKTALGLLWDILDPGPPLGFLDPDFGGLCERLGIQNGFFNDTLFLRGWSVHEILFGGIRPGSVHLIKLVEGLLDLITGIRTLEQLELDLPPWAEGPCDHSIAPWDESAGVRASSNFRNPRQEEDSHNDSLFTIPWVIGDCGFSAFSGRNGTAFQEWYEANTGRATMDDYLELERFSLDGEVLYNDLTGVGWWEPDKGFKGPYANAANLLRGTDGQQFHPGMRKEERLWVFQMDICRSIYAEFEEEVEVKGVKGYRYVAPEEVFIVANRLNLGFCREYQEEVADWDECVKQNPDDEELLLLDDCDLDEKDCPDGIMEVTRCYQGAPTVVSSPHFYQSPSFLAEDFQDFPPPSAETDSTYITVEPVSGQAIEVVKRLQINVPFEKDPLIRAFDAISDDHEDYPIFFPLFWLEEGAYLDDKNADLLKDLVVTPLKLTDAAQWTLVALGGAIALVAGFFLARIVFFSR